MAVADDLLDLKPSQPSVTAAELRMVRPDEALDLHGARHYPARKNTNCTATAGLYRPMGQPGLEPGTDGL
jgi:hypothetical protein